MTGVTRQGACTKGWQELGPPLTSYGIVVVGAYQPWQINVPQSATGRHHHTACILQPCSDRVRLARTNPLTPSWRPFTWPSMVASFAEPIQPVARVDLQTATRSARDKGNFARNAIEATHSIDQVHLPCLALISVFSKRPCEWKSRLHDHSSRSSVPLWVSLIGELMLEPWVP